MRCPTMESLHNVLELHPCSLAVRRSDSDRSRGTGNNRAAVRFDESRCIASSVVDWCQFVLFVLDIPFVLLMLDTPFRRHFIVCRVSGRPGSG